MKADVAALNIPVRKLKGVKNGYWLDKWISGQTERRCKVVMNHLFQSAYKWSSHHPYWSWVIGCVLVGLLVSFLTGNPETGRIFGIILFLGLLGIRSMRKAEQKRKAKETQNAKE